jgi:hypothetical protein
MVAVAVMPTIKLGYAIAWYPKSYSPTGGAAAGRERVVTPTTTMKTATYTDAKPAHDLHISLLAFPNHIRMY